MIHWKPGRKETTRPSLENLERWNIYSYEWKRSNNGRMEQPKAMEYESRKASSDVLKQRYIYIYIIYIYIYDSCRQPQTYIKPEAAITVFELLMMSGVSLETC